MSFEYQARLAEIHAGVSHLRSGQMLAFAIMYAAIAAILLVGFLALTRRGLLFPYFAADASVSDTGRKRWSTTSSSSR
jgi:hypothetical protein